MKLTAVTMVLALVLAPAVTFAHGEQPQAAHGGEVQDAQGVWVELVVKASNVTVYVLAEDQKPVPAAQIEGTATVLVGGGKTHKVRIVMSSIIRRRRGLTSAIGSSCLVSEGGSQGNRVKRNSNGPSHISAHFRGLWSVFHRLV